jgi:hypothetical protein
MRGLDKEKASAVPLSKRLTILSWDLNPPTNITWVALPTRSLIALASSAK